MDTIRRLFIVIAIPLTSIMKSPWLRFTTHTCELWFSLPILRHLEVYYCMSNICNPLFHKVAVAGCHLIRNTSAISVLALDALHPIDATDWRFSVELCIVFIVLFRKLLSNLWLHHGYVSLHWHWRSCKHEIVSVAEFPFTCLCT